MKVIIFGAGKTTEELLQFPLKKDTEILFICDNDKNRWGKYLKGYLIVSPNEILKQEYDWLILSVMNSIFYCEIKKQLRDLNVWNNKVISFSNLETVKYIESDLDQIFEIKRHLIPFSKGPAEIYQDYIGETAKSHDRRLREGFFDKYCQGEGLDIGYGADILLPQCSGWDLRNGDAQYLRGVEDESFDFVYSSHCLEHMYDVREALRNWYRVVRRGGYLIVAIPHRDLYEKKKELPSRWNLDHKHMFLIGKAEKPDTLDIVEEIKNSLDNYDIKYIKACDEGHTITDPLLHSNGEYQIEIVIQKQDKK